MGNKAVRSMEYFAAIDDPIKLADEMKEKVRVFRDWYIARGIMAIAEKKMKAYYGISYGGNSSHALTEGGSEGELVFMKVNDFRVNLQSQLVMVTSQRPAGIARAINSDSKAIKASRLGTAVSEFYMSRPNHGFESIFLKAAEAAIVCDESYVDLFWNKTRGKPVNVDPETHGIGEMSGDSFLRYHCPWNVARDPGATIENQNWHIITYKMNRFDAAATYPRFKDSILAVGDDDLPSIPMNLIPEGSDEIFVHLLVQDRVPAVPTGRYALLIGDDIVLDTELPFDDYPVERMSPSDVIDGPVGYSSANDLLAMEELTDALHSVIATNEIKFGGQTIVGPEGANLKISDIAKGCRYFELPEHLIDKIKSLNLLHTPPEIFNYLMMIGNKKDQTLGLNSVVKGQPEGQLAGASGSALALLQTQAIAFNSGIQKSYFSLLSNVMSKNVRNIARYADTEFIAQIVGKIKSQGLREFKYYGKDLQAISCVVYELVNPISQSVGGKLTMAQDLLKAGQCKSPKQYINVAQTGNIDPLTQDDEADESLILEENEALIDGRPVNAVLYEQHADHIKSHSSLTTQEAKEKDPALAQRAMTHIQQHLDLWGQASATNPGILLATGQQPLLPPSQPPIPPNGHAPQGPGQLVGGPSPVMHKAEEVRQPSLPNIAGTHEKPTIPGVTDRGA